MVLISLQPFALRKLVLAVAALLFFSAFCFADPVFMTRQYAHPAVTAATVSKPSFVPPPTTVDLPAAQIGTPFEVASSEASLWQGPARSNDFLFLELKPLNFPDPNSTLASDLTRFQ